MAEGCQRDLVELGLSAIIRQASHPKLAIQSLALKSLLLLLKKPGSLLSFATAHRHHYASSILILKCFVLRRESASYRSCGRRGEAAGPDHVDEPRRGGRISATELKIEGEPLPVEDRGPPRDRDGPRAGAAGGPQRQLTGEKATGTVKFFNAMKGFGFIQRDDGQPDAFVHISAVERAGMPTLNEGDRLEFELEVDRRGKYAAVNLTPSQ